MDTHKSKAAHISRSDIRRSDQIAHGKLMEAQERMLLIKIFGYTLLAVFVFFGLYALFGSSGNSSDKYGAYAYMQQFVESDLKSPSTAEFEYGGASNGATKIGKNEYRIQSYVDSQNGFGAKIRTYFHGTIKYDDGTWTLESLSFD